MNKNVFLMMAAAAALAGCSNDETVEVLQPEPQPIGFKTFVDKATRAETTPTSLQSSGFWVWADANANATASTSTILEKDLASYAALKWTSENTRYWLADTKYAFTAIGPAYEVTDGNDPLEYTHSVPAAEADFMAKLHGSLTYDISQSKAKTDLVHAYATREVPTAPTSTDYEAVPLTFNHLLSKVTIEFVNQVGMANLRITGVKVTSAKTGALNLLGLPADASGATFAWSGLDGSYTTGILNMPTPTQGNLDLTDVGTSGNPVWVIPANKSARNESIYLLPSQSTLYISFTAQVYSGAEPGQSCAHTGSATITGGLVAGHSYKLTTTLTPENVLAEELHPIEFSVSSVAGWTDGGSSTVTMP